MDRLFLRVYLNVFLGVLVAAVVTRVVILPSADEQVARNVEASLTAPAAAFAELVAASLAAGADPSEPLARASQRGRGPLALVDRSAVKLDAGTLERLDQGAVVRVGPPFASTVYARVEGTTQLLRMGPLRTPMPFAGGRGAAMILVFVVGLALGIWMLLGPLRRQLSDLRATAEALGRGELGARAKVGSRDAVGALTATLNHMGEEIQRLIAEREELLHMTSHELRTPIQRMHFGLERAREAELPEARERALDRIDRDLSELDALIEELLTYVRLKEHSAPAPALVDVRPVVDALCEAMSDDAAGIALVAPGSGGAPLPVGVEARLIRRATSNLIVNALRYARTRVEVTVSREGELIHVHVDDDGAGVPPEGRARIFEPFQRLDDERTRQSRGFGLGLAIVRRIAEAHGGSVAALGSELGGARFRLSFRAA